MGVPLRCRTVLRSSADQRAARHPWPVRATSRGRMRELMGEMLRQAPPEPLRFRGTSAGSPLQDRLLGGVRGLRFRSPGAAALGSGCQAATLWLSGPTAEAWESPGTFDLGECTEGLLCGQPTGMEEGGAPHGAVRVGAEPARKHSTTSLCRGGLRGEEA